MFTTKEPVKAPVFVTPSKRGRGQPRKGNVLFARRVHPSKIPGLLKALSENPYLDIKVNGPIVKTPQLNDMEPTTQYKLQIKELLDDVEALTKDVEDWKNRYKAAAGSTDDQKVHYWMRKCSLLEDQLKSITNDGSS